MIDGKEIYETMKKLVAVPGISGTDAEKETAFRLIELIREQPYFQAHPENAKLVPLVDDPFGRSIVTAFLELSPGTPDTVILTGHYDVVDVEEFGHLQDIAFDVEAATKRINEMPLDADSLKDFQSGEWLFGRGTADMKYGLSLCLALLKHYAEVGGLKGNLLFVAVCGEETNSEGMLRAVPFFNEIAAEKGLQYKALLLTECFTADDQANDPNKYIHYGASGKIMPMFFVAGESTHGGEPFLGLDPSSMSVEIYKRLHMNADFCQQSLGETTPPPVCIKMQDLKTTYSASIPLYAVSYYTLVTVKLDPEEAMRRLQALAEEAMAAAIGNMDQWAADFEKLTGEPPVRYSYKPCVMTFKQLCDEVKTGYAGDFDADMAKYALDLQAQKMSIQDIAVQLVKHVYEIYKDKRPMIILSIIPPYYPDVYVDKREPAAANLMHLCDEIIEYAKDTYGESLKMKDYYMGLSDMSYTGLASGVDYRDLFLNIAGGGSVYQFPMEDLEKFKVPGIVLGGYGKDFHKHTERLNKHYNFEVLPDLYVQLIGKLLG